MQRLSCSEKFFECFARTGVNAAETLLLTHEMPSEALENGEWSLSFPQWLLIADREPDWSQPTLTLRITSHGRSVFLDAGASEFHTS
jgi:hypothetical protein